MYQPCLVSYSIVEDEYTYYQDIEEPETPKEELPLFIQSLIESWQEAIKKRERYELNTEPQFYEMDGKTVLKVFQSDEYDKLREVEMLYFSSIVEHGKKYPVFKDKKVKECLSR